MPNDFFLCQVYYKKEFNKLCSDFYALSNFSYKNNDVYKASLDRMNERLKKEVIEPVFKYNYKATLSKIEVILSESDIDRGDFRQRIT